MYIFLAHIHLLIFLFPCSHSSNEVTLELRNLFKWQMDIIYLSLGATLSGRYEMIYRISLVLGK